MCSKYTNCAIRGSQGGWTPCARAWLEQSAFISAFGGFEAAARSHVYQLAITGLEVIRETVAGEAEKGSARLATAASASE